MSGLPGVQSVSRSVESRLSTITLASPPVSVGDPDSTRIPFLTAAWRHLLFVNFVAEPGHLIPSLPPGTELDLYDGRAMVSLVGLRFIRTKVIGVPVPFLGAFDQVDLRFCVLRRSPNGDVRRGVVFLRELVPQSVLAFAARLTLHEPFEAAALRSSVPYGGFDATGRIEYTWQLENQWYVIDALTKGKPGTPEPGSETGWLAHRLWSYTRHPDGSTLEFEFSHPRWRTWDVTPDRVRIDAEALRLAPALSGRPHSAFVAEGSKIKAFHPISFRHART